MNAVSPMELVWGRVGRWLNVWWASPQKSFTRPGLYVWIGWPVRRNLRVLRPTSAGRASPKEGGE